MTITIPWFIPHLRHVEDHNSEKSFESSSIESEQEIREYRDEANRPWYKFFDEYEYRYTDKQTNEHRWWNWFEKGTSDAEKKLVWKLYILVGFYSFLGYWIKYLDSSNLNNAYVSGLKGDIGMKGNDLIDTQVLFLVGGVIFELPWLFLLPRVPITYVLFACEFAWSILTLALYKVTDVATLKALRFLIGCCEAAYFPCVHYLFLVWFKSTEVGRIGGIFYIGQFLGILTSGLLQGAASKLHGLKGWQWMFLIDGLISLAVAIIGLFSLPGTPTNCYSIWLTDDEIRLARKRMRENHTDISPTVKSFFHWPTWKNILTSWHFWLLLLAQMCGFNTNSASSGSFALWLLSLDRYSIAKLNNLTTIPPALGILWIILVCGGADLTRKRFLCIIFSQFMNFVANTILATWHVSETAKWAGFLLTYFSWSQSSVFNPLINDILRHDANQKSIEWMIIYILGLQSNAWISRLVFPTTDAPRFKRGFASCAGFSIAFNLILLVAYFFYKRDERKNALRNGIYIYNSAKGEIPPIDLKVALNRDDEDEELEGSEKDEKHIQTKIEVRESTL